MKVFLGLLVGSAIFVAMTRARSLDQDELVQELPSRSLDVADQLVQGQYQKRQSAHHSDGSEQEYDRDVYGDFQVADPVTDCVTSIAKTGIKRAFPECKAYIKQVMEFCSKDYRARELNMNLKRPREEDCESLISQVTLQ